MAKQVKAAVIPKPQEQAVKAAPEATEGTFLDAIKDLLTPDAPEVVETKTKTPEVSLPEGLKKFDKFKK